MSEAKRFEQLGWSDIAYRDSEHTGNGFVAEGNTAVKQQPARRKPARPSHKLDIGTDFSWLNDNAAGNGFILPADFCRKSAGVTVREEKEVGSVISLRTPEHTVGPREPVQGEKQEGCIAEKDGKPENAIRTLSLLHPDGTRTVRATANVSDDSLPRTASGQSVLDSLPRTASGILKARPMEHLTSYAMVKSVLDYCLDNGRYRDYCCWMIGLSTGLRICDIVKLKLSDVFTDCVTVTPGKMEYRDEKRKAAGLATSYERHTLHYREAINIVEQKTKKRTVSNVDAMIITESLRTGINTYLQSKGYTVSEDGMEVTVPTGGRYNGYLLTHLHDYGNRPLTTETQYEMVKSLREPLHLPHVGTHSMRKTFLNIANTIACTGNFNGNATALSDVQVLAHHSKPETTLRYMNAIKPRVVSLRKAVSDFLMGRTKVKELEVEYEWELEDQE